MYISYHFSRPKISPKISQWVSILSKNWTIGFFIEYESEYLMISESLDSDLIPKLLEIFEIFQLQTRPIQITD